MNASPVRWLVFLLSTSCVAHTNMASSRDEHWRSATTRLGAELQYFAPYVRRLAEECSAKFDLRLQDRSPLVIDTDPPTYESAWELHTCKTTMAAMLDCSARSGRFACGAHQWPEARYPDALLGHELAAAAEAAPSCPSEKSCTRDREHRCAEDGFVLQREKTQVESSKEPWHVVSEYRVSRCGVAQGVRVDCVMREPYSCTVTARAE